MRVSEKDCEYVWFYDWDYSDDTCCLSINLELWDKNQGSLRYLKQ